MDTLTGYPSRLTELSSLQSLCLHDQDNVQIHISHCMLTDERLGIPGND